MNKLGGEIACTLDIAAAPAQVDPDVAALRPSKLLQALSESRDASLSLGIALVGVHQRCEAAHAIRLLRACDDRPRGCAAEKRYEFPPPHTTVLLAETCFFDIQ